MTKVSKELVATARLQKTTAKPGAGERSALDEFVGAVAGRSMLLVDVSSSMCGAIRSGERRIDALRKVVELLRETNPVPVVAFGGHSEMLEHENVAVVDDIPEPSGGTPMHDGISFCAAKGATHIVLVTDGVADSESAAVAAAQHFGGIIDAFYIGDGNDKGARFCARLAKLTGGTANVEDLNDTKLLHSKIAGLLPEVCD